MKQQHRRDFIKQASATLLAGFSLKDLEQLPPIPNGNANDETYWKSLREQFPLSKDVTYLNNGSMGPSPYPVIEAVKTGMMEGDEIARYGEREETVKMIAGFTRANDNEIAITHNTTEGINIMCWGLPLKKGDEVILTTHEHAGNALPWLNRQKLDGIVLKTFSPASTAAETLNRIDALISKKTKVIAVPHILCTQGQVLPVKEICKLGKTKGVFVCIDGAHTPGMMPLDLHDMGCDAFAGCCHKWMLGPKGTGFLYVRKDFQETLIPRFVGAGSDTATWNMADEHPLLHQYMPNAHRYYGGTQNTGLHKGIEASIDFMNAIGMDKVYYRVNMLGKYMQDALLELDGKVEVMNPVEPASRCGMNGFRIKDVPFDTFYQKAMEHNFRIRIMHENGLKSLRVSTHIYNSTEEVDRLIELIKNVSK
jgi:selenocysteine lyase/cysteine desulfurase